MKNLKSITIVATIFTLLGLLGCKKEELILENSNDIKTSVEVSENILCFSNQKSFDSTFSLLNQMSPEELNIWETNIGFKSQQTIFNTIVKDEDEYDKSLYSLKDLSSVKPHSETYSDYLNKGIIKEVVMPDSSITYDYNLMSPALACIVNEQGYFKIEDTLFFMDGEKVVKNISYKENHIKTLSSYNETNKSINIFVYKNNLKHSVSRSSGMQTFDGGKKSLLLSVSFNSYQYFSNGTQWKYNHTINIQAQDKNIWGKWKYVTAQMYLRGTWSGRLYYEDPVYLSTRTEPFGSIHPSNYPAFRTFAASNFYSSMSIMNGSIGAYPTTYIVSYPARIIDIMMDSFSWEAQRNGGCCGKSVSVSF